MAAIIIFLFVAFSALILIMFVHQDPAGGTASRTRRFWILVVFSNGVVIGLLTAFVLLVKEILGV
jgi:hypothetical protein